ncbi:MAG: proteasome accessory factor PafA2 family protein [Bowdeniella nasicola]|nr:proteasome accessory factor PafA2 family protein [Bowdeniella nasicola]
MITVRRVMGVETEYALLDTADPAADPDTLATDLLYAYARAAAPHTAATEHVPGAHGRTLEPGAGCRFDYSGERPRADARGMTAEDLPEEARTDEVRGASLTGARTTWVLRITPFESHYYRGSATHAANGGRLYVDHTHPEYAAPEALGPEAAALYDQAGDVIMARAVTALNEQQGRRAVVVKNNTDGKGQAWGAHESYAMARDVDWDLITAVLLPFLVTRPIIGGAGRVGLGPAAETDGFQIFARADFIETDVSLHTTRERPIVNTRDEPHAEPGEWRRLHVITADSSMFATTAVLRLGSLAALLDLLEKRDDIARSLAESYTLADPVAAVREVSRDLTLTAPLPLAHGGQATALEIQRGFYEAIREAAGTTCDAETARVLDLWGEALDALTQAAQNGSFAPASQLIEWCAKYQLLERLRRKYDCGWGDPRLKAADLQFAMVGPASSLASALERSGAVRTQVTAEEVAAAEFTAPADTRAGGRAALLAAYPDRVWAAGWTSIVVDIDRKHLLRVELNDPLHPTAAEMAEAIEGSPSLADTVTRLGAPIPEDPVTLGWHEGVYATDNEDEEETSW